MAAPVLHLLDFSKECIIETDALKAGIGAVLIQDGHPIDILIARNLVPSYKLRVCT